MSSNSPRTRRQYPSLTSGDHEHQDSRLTLEILLLLHRPLPCPAIQQSSRQAHKKKNKEGLASSAMRHEDIGDNDNQRTRVDQDVPDTIIMPSETTDSTLVKDLGAGTTASPACDRTDQMGIIDEALDVKQVPSKIECAVFFDARDVSEEPQCRDDDTQHDRQHVADDQEQQNPISADPAINDAGAEMAVPTPPEVSSDTADAGTSVEMLSQKMDRASIVDDDALPIADDVKLEVERGDQVLEEPMKDIPEPCMHLLDDDVHRDDSVRHVDQDTISANHAGGDEGYVNMDTFPPHVSTTSDITPPETADISVAGPLTTVQPLDKRTDQAIIEETPYAGGHGKLKTECIDGAVQLFPQACDSPPGPLTSELPTETQEVIDDSQTLTRTRSSLTKSSNTTLDSVPKEQDVLSTDKSGSGMTALDGVQAEPEPHASCSTTEDGVVKPAAVDASSEPAKIDGMCQL